MIEHKGLIVLKEKGKPYIVKSLAKLADEPNAYIFSARDLETKEEFVFKIDAVGFLDALDSAINFEESILILNVSSGEWKMWTYLQN